MKRNDLLLAVGGISSSFGSMGSSAFDSNGSFSFAGRAASAGPALFNSLSASNFCSLLSGIQNQSHSAVYRGPLLASLDQRLKKTISVDSEGSDSMNLNESAVSQNSTTCRITFPRATALPAIRALKPTGSFKLISENPVRFQFLLQCILMKEIKKC